MISRQNTLYPCNSGARRAENETAPCTANEICRTCNWPGGVASAQKGAVYSNYGVTLLENLTRGTEGRSELPTVYLFLRRSLTRAGKVL